MIDDNNETKTYFTAEIIDLVPFYVCILFNFNGKNICFLMRLSEATKLFYRIFWFILDKFTLLRTGCINYRYNCSHNKNSFFTFQASIFLLPFHLVCYINIKVRNIKGIFRYWLQYLDSGSHLQTTFKTYSAFARCKEYQK